jgi:hypothetical protein
MKTNPDPDNEDPLLEAILRDDDWQAANAAGKAEALRLFQTRRRIRCLTQWGGGLAGLAMLAVCAAHWLARPPAPIPVRVAQTAPAPPAPPEKSIYLTDGQLLALFPRGSCFLAEVDGKKKLVFFDPEVEREYVSDAVAPRSFTP